MGSAPLGRPKAKRGFFVSNEAMNIILLEERDFVADHEVKLAGRRYEHARDVLNVQENDQVRVGLVNGRLGTGLVRFCQDGALRLVVDLTEAPPVKHDITLVLALPRPPVFRRVLSAVAALGLKRIVVVHSARVEKSYWNSPSLSEDRVRAALMLGLEQARDTVLPEISFEDRFRPFVEDRLPELSAGKRCFVATTEDAAPCPANIVEPIVMAVGPEGGFVDFELRQFHARGFRPVHLGPRILRVETAVQALIGRAMPVC